MNVKCNSWNEKDEQDWEKLQVRSGSSQVSATVFCVLYFLKRSEFATTESELRLIARLAHMGEINMPNRG